MIRKPETRLVYSTGGEKPEPSNAQQKPPRSQQPPKGIRLRLERRASDRVVTVIDGLPGVSKALMELARELKTACGAGGSLKGRVLELQGDQRTRVEAALEARGLASKRAGG